MKTISDMLCCYDRDNGEWHYFPLDTNLSINQDAEFLNNDEPF